MKRKLFLDNQSRHTLPLTKIILITIITKYCIPLNLIFLVQTLLYVLSRSFYKFQYSPLQGSTLHSSKSSLSGPGQNIPPYLVSGLEHFRVRVKFPFPHGRLQSLYSVHWLQAPSTEEHNKENVTHSNSENQLF